jgi:hypothetical protein
MMPPLVHQSQCCSAKPKVSAPHYAKIVFNIIRDSKKDSSDDMVVIGRETHETYSYTYTDKTSKASKKSCRHSGLSGSQVKNLLSNLFNLLHLDDEPFYGLQVVLPSTPSVMLKMEDLNSRTRDLLYESVENVMESWPVMV